MLEVFIQLFKTVLQMFSLLLSPIFLIPLGIVGLIFLKKNTEYKESSYYHITKTPYLFVRFDLGRWGEYLTYKYLKKFELEGAKFLFNVYIPKEKEETTEIDVLMISPKGIFVFESKNYSGWIFGSEGQKKWCQTLPVGRGRSHKEYFYNPIMQNRSHIKYLKALVGEQFLTHSIIVFSERCTLKNVEVKSNNIKVINRDEVLLVVSDTYKETEDILTEEDIMSIYDRLYPFTQISDDLKMQHIANIQKKLMEEPADVPDEAGIVLKKESEKPYVTEDVLAEPSLDVSGEADGKQVESNKTQFDESEMVKLLESKETQEFVCPKCGGKLILRTAKRGENVGKQFWGCANYPKCRYIKNVVETDKNINE